MSLQSSGRRSEFIFGATRLVLPRMFVGPGGRAQRRPLCVARVLSLFKSGFCHVRLQRGASARSHGDGGEAKRHFAEERSVDDLVFCRL